MQSPPKELFLTILTWFLILDKIQDGGHSYLHSYFAKHWGPVHTYLAIFESFPDMASTHTHPWIRHTILQLLNPLSGVEIFEYARNPESCGR